MKATVLRGRVLTFWSEPLDIKDDTSFTYIENGAVRVEDGSIVAVGDFSDIDSAEALVVDHRPYILFPGFIDAHTHFPQMQAIASWGSQLLEWLETYTFPAEAKFSDEAHSRKIARRFLDELINHGTTTAAVYCTVHKESVEAFFEEAEAREMRMIAGKVMMDRNAPDNLCDTAQSAYDDSKALINKWHYRGRALYAVTPRFAITSTEGQMEAAQALTKEHLDVYVQTHLSENHDEIAFTAKLYPDARDYLDVYERYGLVDARSLFGHSLHLNERERSVMAETRSVAVFCPTSNLFLGSGLYDEKALRETGVRRAIATDVGGGTNYSMLRTLDEGYKVLQLQAQRLDPLKSFYWATLGNARGLQLEDRIGTLKAGTEADIVVLNSHATSAMATRMETVGTLQEELFVLQTLGDDRAIVETYVAGVPRKSELRDSC